MTVLYPLWAQNMPECHRCGRCCGVVMVSAQEGASIGAFCREQGISWRPEGDPLTCGYLGEDKECRIYSRRPLVCRLYGLIAELACPYHSEAVCTSLPADKALRDILGTTTLHLLAEVV